MLFSSLSFIYYFLPVLLVIYFIVPKKLKNVTLLLFSLLFYFWGEPIYTFLMLGSTLVAYLLGLVIDKYRGKALSKAAMIATVVIEIGLLMLFKYSDFFIESINAISSLSIKAWGIALPIGISFYTFQILSYTIDLYNGKTEVQKNPISFATYVTLFPQLIAGPIVRYTDVAAELEYREHNLNNFASGASRFVLGLGKKVLISNTLGELCSIFKEADNPSVLFVWLYVIAYSLHIYFDFSGYSDMAIGLGRIFGFKFPENFNYPYISKSITEFWRRWHISLGSWFRDYVYIPLGGNRVPAWRHILNILVVWFLTGFWHGAGWTFILWGLYFAVFLLIEKFFLGKLLAKLPGFVSHIYAIILLMFGWVLFDAASASAAITTIGQMFGIGASGAVDANAVYYLRSYALPLIVGLIGCTPLPKMIVNKLFNSKAKPAFAVIEPIVTVVLLVVITAFLIDGSFNPFIYFRF